MDANESFKALESGLILAAICRREVILMKVGIQLYSVRQHMEKDPIDTIRTVAEAGYRNLEIANHSADTDVGVGFGVSTDEINALLKETGASVVGGHISPFSPLTESQRKAILEYHACIGTKYIVMPMDFYKAKDEVLRKAEAFNQAGKECKEAGIQFVYHNHYHEFQHFGDETVYDIIMNNTDPELLKIELDTFWAMRSGNAPIDLLKKYGSRVCLIHQKDYMKGYEGEINLLQCVEENNEYVDSERFGRDVRTETFTEIGTGIMDIQAIIDTAIEHCAIDYIILEQDYSQHDEIDSIKLSMEEFKKFKGIEW